ncbi:ATP-binding cassette domain-containing protein [Actinacidiphila paucisporea]|uniref:ABC transporter n=1 Tax=Actinacidiphila paucisporea TaxID=310782 RepID=A0A1M7NQG5_9ACTN|nr:ABC transporter [Actinacidiphila paucisporea]
MTVAYGHTDVVRDGAVAIRPAEVTALVGPNGSGKSTLLRTLARLQRARSGTLTVDGYGRTPADVLPVAVVLAAGAAVAVARRRQLDLVSLDDAPRGSSACAWRRPPGQAAERSACGRRSACWVRPGEV